MPRKPKLEKQTITVVINGTPVAIILHPPAGSRKTWYAYWNGLVSSRSTGQQTLEEAIRAAEAMVRNGGRQTDVADAVMTDQDFEAIQRAHFAKKVDPAAKVRAEKTLESVLESIAAFKAITGLPHVAAATADDCAKFQAKALTLPRNWRKQHPKSKEDNRPLSPNTILKWSRSLQAAFERVNRSAGKTCVRGVVNEAKLLTMNPWTQFTWIGGMSRPIRQLGHDDLTGFLTFLGKTWHGVPVAINAAKVFLWSGCRKLEVASLRWEQVRFVTENRRVVVCEMGDRPVQRIKEVHFEIVGKWGVERWFRVPHAVFNDLLAHRTDSPYVFAAYTDQLRHVHSDNAGCLKKIKDGFTARNFGRWFYERVKEWSDAHPNGNAYVHLFRKTALQLALDGEDDADQRVADDAGVSKEVLLGHYAKPKLWKKSNRTFRRLIASLPPEVARCYGHVDDEETNLERQLQLAVEAQNWELVAVLSAQLSKRNRTEAG